MELNAMDCFFFISQLHWKRYDRYHHCEYSNYAVNVFSMCFIFSLLIGGTLFASLLCMVRPGE